MPRPQTHSLNHPDSYYQPYGRALTGSLRGATTLDLFFRKRKRQRELEALRESIELKKAEVEAGEREGRKAWGKKWSYIQMHRRGHDTTAEGPAVVAPHEDHGEVFEIRLKYAQTELKAKESELAALVARERELAAKLGVESSTPSEVNDEER